MKIVDPHVHFFNLAAGEYKWLQPQNPPEMDKKSLIFRDFDEHSLVTNENAQLLGYVHIEAGFDNKSPFDETIYWDKRASTPLKCVQGCDLSLKPEEFIKQIRKGAVKSLIGVRQYNNNIDAIHHPNAITNLKVLADMNLILELQLSLDNKESTKTCARLMENFSNLDISLNHAGFLPKTKTLAYKRWQEHFSLLAQHPLFFVKISGLEMRQATVTADDMLFALDAVLNAQDEQNVAIASNFPLVLFANSYEDYWQKAHDAVVQLGLSADRLTACNAYNYYFKRKTLLHNLFTPDI